jgi:hypothetical protein
MLQQVYGEGICAEYMLLCGLNSFKTEGKLVEMMKDPAILHLQEIIQMWKKLQKW